jgi:hypothetical protein
MYFTYLIGWTKFNKYYYGVRYKDGITTESLGTTYFTSSNYVKKFIEENGIPDIMVIRKTFICKLKARKWEDKVIRRMKMIYSDKWLNKSNPNSFRDVVMDEDIKRRISEVKKGRKVGKYYNNGKINKIFKQNETIPYGWFVGRISTEKQKEHIRNLNKSLTPEKRKLSAEKCSITAKGRKKPLGHGEKVSKALKGRKNPWQLGENNVSKRPEVKEKISKAKKGKPLNGSMFNNGIENKFIYHGDTIPEGFKKGVLISEEAKKRIKERFENSPPLRWYTNGKESIRVIEGRQPEGWYIGRNLHGK